MGEENTALRAKTKEGILSTLKKAFRGPWGFRKISLWIWRLLGPLSLFNPFKFFQNYLKFFRDLYQYRHLPNAEKISFWNLYPYLYDRTGTTPLDPNYFYQDTWAAGKIFQTCPSLHVDIGSTALFVGILSKFTRICSVEIRPLKVKLDGLIVCAGDALSLPFSDKSIRSLSSLCVIEHVGLGRYGDSLIPRGTDLAAAELQRVLAPGGDLYVSVPIEAVDKVYFNAHRTFTFDSFVAKFQGLNLVEARFVQNGRPYYLEERQMIDFSHFMVFGLFHFRRPLAERRKQDGAV
jgi:SAM-dependent methyltransferase